MKLEELIPERPVFALSSTSKEYELRIPNLEDRVAMQKICGSHDQIVKVFQERDWTQICVLVYRLMVDRSDFKAFTERKINDEGVEQEMYVTGPMHLLRSIKTQTEAVMMMGALTTAITEGDPLIKDFVREEVKKNKQQRESLIGEKYSTSSPANTDTPQPNSDNSPTENSA
jgi:hypothetical protein